MPQVRRTAAFVLFAVALFTAPAHAQMAPYFDQLPSLLKPGDAVIVIDAAGRETWGRIALLTPSAVEVSPMHWSGRETVTKAERRTFAAADVQLIARTDDTGARTGVVFPASWERVEALPSGADITIKAESGERRRYRFEATAGELLQLTHADGRQASVNKRAVRRIERNGHHDGAGDGTAIGALIGAGSGLALIGVAYSMCGRGCDAPARLPMFSLAALYGGGIGAFTGWLVDRLHKGKDVVYPVPPSRLTTNTTDAAR